MAKFLVDGMLGKLARWLRVLGVDTSFDSGADDDELVGRAVNEDRILLTRDRRLAERRLLRGRVVLIGAESWPDQIRELARAQDLTGLIHPLTRCLRCNTVLEDLAPAAAAPRVPPYIAATHSRYYHCPTCARIYWPGTHRERMSATLARLGLPELSRPPEAGSGQPER